MAPTTQETQTLKGDTEMYMETESDLFVHEGVSSDFNQLAD